MKVRARGVMKLHIYTQTVPNTSVNLSVHPNVLTLPCQPHKAL